MTGVVDTSAIICALFEEEGYEEATIALADGVVSTVNLSESASVLMRRGLTANKMREVLSPIAERAIAADISQALDAGLLHSVTQAAGLSLGDRFCLALARHLRTHVATADRAWLQIAKEVSVDIRLIR